MEIRLWNLLHDGVMVSLARLGGDLHLCVDASYLRGRFEAPGEHFLLILRGCSGLSYTPYGGALLTSLPEIEALQPEILEARLEGGALLVVCAGGLLSVCYVAHELWLNEETRSSVEALDACAVAYWEEWERKQKP